VVPSGNLPAQFDKTTVVVEAIFTVGDPNNTTFKVVGDPSSTSFQANSAQNLPDGTRVVKFYPRRSNDSSPISVNTDVAPKNEREAFLFGYYGASTWGNAPAVQEDEDGCAVALFVSTGQNHSLPWFEVDWIYGNSNTRSFFQREAYSTYYVNQYLANPTASNLAAVRTAYAQVQTWITNELSIALSPRGNANMHSSVLAISLVLGTPQFGTVSWFQRTVAVDHWHQGFVTNALQLDLTTFSPGAGYVSVEDFYFSKRGADGDMGAGPILLQDLDPTLAYVVGCDKAGDAIRIAYPKSNLSGPRSFTRVFVGNSGTAGGANYGVCSDGTNLYSIQANTLSGASVNLYPLSGSQLLDPASNYPQNFQPFRPWISNSSSSSSSPTVYTPFQSYLSAVSVSTFDVAWDAFLRLPSDTSIQTSVCPLTVSKPMNPTSLRKGVVFASGANAQLMCFDATNGTFLCSYQQQGYGNSHVILGATTVVLASGRGNVGGAFSPTTRLQVWNLD
jgi:hypothetical protein